MQYQHSDFKLTFADSSFSWSAAPRPGLPILRWPDGTVCEPALYYFGYSAVVKRTRSISSMRPEAYAIREWFVFLANKGLNVLEGTDELMEEWQTIQGWVISEDRRGKQKPKRSLLIKNARIARKLHNVFEFYLNFPNARPFDKAGNRTPIMVGVNDGAAKRFPIGSKLVWNGRLKKHCPAWIRAERVHVSVRPPKVPTKSELIILFNHLRGKGFRQQQERKLEFPPLALQILADRDWLMAKVMTGAGLRCEEVANLSVEQIAEALWRSGITKSLLRLEKITNDYAEQDEIKRRVLSIKDGGELSFILVFVHGKGKKERYAPFSPNLICDILQFIWTFRAKKISSIKGGNLHHCPSSVFLSSQDNNSLNPGSIGDLIGAAYRACGIKGSAHKLRGHFATDVAAALWREYFALNQYRFDQALVNKLLDQLAAYMGHSFVTTTEKFYLDQELFRHLTRVGSAEAKLFHKLWDILVMQKRGITETQSRIILKMAGLVSQSDDNSRLIRALDIMMNDERFIPGLGKESLAKLSLAYDADDET